MARREKAVFGERHLVEAIKTSPRDEKPYLRYARWLKGQGRPIEAEAQESRARHCHHIDFAFDYEGPLKKFEATIGPWIGETVVTVNCNGWAWTCDVAELQAWLLDAGRRATDLNKLPGDLEGPSQSILQSLWEEGVADDGMPIDSRRVSGQMFWLVVRIEDPVEGEYYVLGA